MPNFIIPKTLSSDFIPDFINGEHNSIGREILISTIGKNINGNTITLLDLFNIKGLKSDKEIEIFINKALTKQYCFENQIMDINTPEGIERINELFDEAIRIYEEVFYRKFPDKLKNKKFKSKSEIINFLKNTSRGDINAEINCFIAKIVYATNDILENPRLRYLDMKAGYMIGKKIIPGIQIDNYEIFEIFGIGKGSVNIAGEKIDFNLRYRGKSSDKSLLKLINDPNYGYSELINDSIGIEFEVNSEKYAFLILNRFFVTLFNEQNSDGSFANFAERFKNKNLLTLEGLEKLIKDGYKLNDEFVKFIKSSINLTEDREKSNVKYQDAKFYGKVKIPKELYITDAQLESHGIELRTVLVGNNNEEGLADHRILDTLKIIYGIIRITGYIRINEIKKLINILFDENPDLIEENGLNHEMVFNYYIEDKLLKVKSGNKTFYTTNNRFNTLNGTKLYPNNIKKA